MIKRDKNFREKMQDEYKHFSEKDRKKIKMQKEITKHIKKSGIMILFCSMTGFIFVASSLMFYKLIDGKEEYNFDGTQKISVKDKKDANYWVGNDKDFEKKIENFSNDEKIDKDEKINKDEKIQKNKIKNDFTEWNKNCPTEMVVVNKYNAIDETYKVNTKICHGKEISELAWANLDKMISDAANDGVILWISSGYRSIKYQKKLFENQVYRELNKGAKTNHDAELMAEKVVARPGMSEHNLGLAVDFNGVSDDFYTTKEYKWLMDNSVKYGFIERYQKKWTDITGVIYEPWHFRYVGENAKDIKESNLSLEEYIEKKFL